jgi:hypothetical protein
MIALVLRGVGMELLAADLDDEPVVDEQVNSNLFRHPDLRSGFDSGSPESNPRKRLCTSLRSHVGCVEHRMESTRQGLPEHLQIHRLSQARRVMKPGVEHCNRLVEGKQLDALAQTGLEGYNETLVRAEACAVANEQGPAVRAAHRIRADADVEGWAERGPKSVVVGCAQPGERSARRCSLKDRSGEVRKRNDPVARSPQRSPFRNRTLDRVFADSEHPDLTNSCDSPERGHSGDRIERGHSPRLPPARACRDGGCRDLWADGANPAGGGRAGAQGSRLDSGRVTASAGESRRIVAELRRRDGSSAGSRPEQLLVRLSERFRSVITSGGRAWRVTRAAKGI